MTLGGRVPDARHPIGRTGDDRLRRLVANRDAEHRAAMAFEFAQGFVSAGIPNAGGPVVRTRDNSAAILADGDTAHGPNMAPQNTRAFDGRHFFGSFAK